MSKSQGCALFSATGILFMCMVGVMLIKQPFLMGGIKDVEKAKSNAFGAAGTFFFTFIISCLYMIVEGRHGNVPGGSSSIIPNGNVGLGEYAGVALTEQPNGLQASGVGYSDDPFSENPLMSSSGYRDDPQGIYT